MQCSFCDDKERVKHLFFDCVVEKAIWNYACDFLSFKIGTDYIYVAYKWLSKENFYVANTISSAVC
jgi:hypothetical protein